jgi:cytosine/adenosine deaminase-related metal-dependent hydrolase
LFDCLISGGHVLDEAYGEPFACDLGIDYSHGNRLALTMRRDGKIVDLGDLSTSRGKINPDATGCLILPGRIAVLFDWGPRTQLSEQQLNALLTHGTTTVIGCVDIADQDGLDAILNVKQLPFNWGFVARSSSARSLPRSDMLECLALAAARGVLAIVAEQADEVLWQHLDRCGIPLLQAKQLADATTVSTCRDLIQQNTNVCKLLGLDDERGRVARGRLADLQLFQVVQVVHETPPLDWQQLRRVVVAGETVWEDGRRTGTTPGVCLRCK